MKRFLIPLFISFTTGWHASVAFASSPSKDGPELSDKIEADSNPVETEPSPRKHGFKNRLFDDLQERRRQREELGFRRLKQMKWQKGYTMPQHYRGDSYKVDYESSNLPKPETNQQWYRINNDYLLIDSSSNVIIDTK